MARSGRACTRSTCGNTASAIGPACTSRRSLSYHLGRQLFAHLDREGHPTAVFAASDTIAIGLLQAAFQAKVVVPDRMSIVGFDDIDIAAFTIPPLTTISQSGVEMGRVSADLLLDLIEGRTNGDTPTDVVVPPILVVRQSTSPVA